jgi:hypothetical protein
VSDEKMQRKSQQTIFKKSAKSPQPSSNILTTTQYLKTLQSQEFQLKEKASMKLKA